MTDSSSHIELAYSSIARDRINSVRKKYEI